MAQLFFILVSLVSVTQITPFFGGGDITGRKNTTGVWKGKSIGSIPPAAVPMIRLMQQQGANKEDIIAFIKKAKIKKPSPKSDVCKNFDSTKLKPVLPDDAPIAVVLFAGGGGIEAGMVQAGIRPVIAVEFDPTKPDLSRAIALNHHRNFSEYGCRIIQLMGLRQKTPIK
ncbi:MAG: hypothetical protein RMZ43_031060 [Nostoc sp. CmiVER01]|uniref:hypothetical protein n=1 Tax=Nostoc sp. CmiVER01 TaxID=3075384 RepID=UPI002AD508B3|nr:hypothetical protein [Nostoc sp. CmiVER01]MDZ8124289.1 hypothetical protein [Nostoc sp. CmiVER01]